MLPLTTTPKNISGGKNAPAAIFYLPSDAVFWYNETKAEQKEGMSMRTIQAAALTDAVAKLCIQANTRLPQDIVAALEDEDVAHCGACGGHHHG